MLGCVWGEMAGEEEELKGSLPNELTVHISNTWNVKPTLRVILQKEKKKKRFHSSFGQCENLLAAALWAAVWQFRRQQLERITLRMQRFASSEELNQSLGNRSSRLHSTAGLQLPASSVWLGIPAGTLDWS